MKGEKIMKSRKERIQKNNNKKAKVLIGTVLLSAGIASSVSVAFADQNIDAMLTNWFNNKKSESIQKIEQAIMSEKEIQKDRLKEQLQLEIQQSEKELQTFTEEEKQRRVDELKRYTDELIANIDVNNENKEKKIAKELETILQNAEQEMNKVAKTGKEDEPKDTGNNGNGNGNGNNNGNGDGKGNDNGKSNVQEESKNEVKSTETQPVEESANQNQTEKVESNADSAEKTEESVEKE